MKSILNMTKEEQDEVLSLAARIQKERAKDAKFQSLDDARIVMIRWDVPYSKYQCSYHSVNVSIDDVKELVKIKIFGENNEK
jgi:hypothetical protein